MRNLEAKPPVQILQDPLEKRVLYLGIEWLCRYCVFLHTSNGQCMAHSGRPSVDTPIVWANIMREVESA